ncbi:TPA: phage N-6-adenine-methyltransferase [Pasteurella multocida]|uniref:phage N-6-adenine-methyltransferase n=1 Tax=Pasteurella multocida TaxID=747 RepID=UPI001EE187A5|nr:phage N-6-adenine-methyltransferase [Pasteurella multocida]MDX3890424.1 phage N-6-adenine-methyltransferase [Pasteurella multocida]MDX3893049.1 phage N-6-adenine-methyltransferase [Pasteurella multocida]MDX3898755.1 phage N-6-adenine-methyltransferase [Pasteurella multocida]MDX3954315.1 phage N-6-adenine-methyltransferase [Pasteurella multocida]MDX3956421.1 phage N-6-adenine-methyltransferase [Pasteurella multocida]
MDIQFNKDHYRTPKYVFNWLDRRFYFLIDGCASEHNALCSTYIGDGINAAAPDFLTFEPLEQVIETAEATLRIFVNPPYSNPLPFVQRAAELRNAGYLVVMLLPADKSTKWYQVIQDNATEVIDIVGGRINFLHPVSGEEIKGNNKGSMVAVFDPTMQGFVTRQVSLKFIKEWGHSE